MNSVGTTESVVQTFTTTNTLPVFTSTPIEEGIVGQEYAYTFTATDADGDALSYTDTTIPDWLKQEITVSTFTGAEFNNPTSVAVDRFGNIYVADAKNHSIRKITSDGQVTTFAGSGNPGDKDAKGTNAQFDLPFGVAVDAAGNVYVADRRNHKIRKITPDGEVTTLAGSTQGYKEGSGSTAKFNDPYGVAADAAGNVYVADIDNHRIRKITSDGEVTTFAGSTQGYKEGSGSTAKFYKPYGVALDAAGNVYVADTKNNKIRKISKNGMVTTIGGANTFNQPKGIAVDGAGNVYVGDTNDHMIRKISPDGNVSTVAGSAIEGFKNGIGEEAKFKKPEGLGIDGTGSLYVADVLNHKIRKIVQNTLIGTPASDDMGDHDVTIEVIDFIGDAVEQTFTISVKGKPSVTAADATDITSSGVTLNGNVTSDGNATITERGFVYALTSVDATPTFAEANGTTVFIVTQTGTTAAFSKALTGLQSNSNYSYVAYAKNSAGNYREHRSEHCHINTVTNTKSKSSKQCN